MIGFIKETVMNLSFKAFSKDQLKSILNLDLKKQELFKIFTDKLNKDKDFRIACYKQYPKEFALTPNQFCEITGMTNYQRKKWNNKIPVVYKETIIKWNQEITFNMYDRHFAENVYSPNLLKEWEASIVKKPRKTNAEQTKITRQLHKHIFDQYNKEFKAMLKSWSDISEECKIIFELAYWTHWISCWAKTKQLSRRSHAKSKLLYEMKNEAMALLSKTKFTELGFYEPERKDKIRLNLCPEHYKLYRGNIHIDNIIDFYYRYKNKIHKCKYCQVEEISDYYSLYYLEIKHPNINECYSFHVPYTIGIEFLPDKDTLPKVKHLEQEGVFRFGKPVSEDEKLTHSERKVIDNFKKSLEKLKVFYAL